MLNRNVLHAALGILLLGFANAYAVPGPLVDTEWLAANLKKVVVLDVRADRASFEKRSRGQSGPVNPCGIKAGKKPFSVSGHIPGAVLVLWENLIEARKIRGVEVKYLVPNKNSFERLMQKSGVNNNSAIVITSNGVELGDAPLSTRLYWTLKYFGHDNVAILNGGTARWIKEKRKVKYGKSRPKRGNFKAKTKRTKIRAMTANVLAASKTGKTQLVDARSQELYLGLTYHAEFVPASAKGHIPGAKNFPLNLMVNSSDLMTTFYSKADILKAAALKNVKTAKSDTIFYCNSGAYSSLGWFVWHELLGNKKTRLYDGSMHEWSRNASRAVSAMKIE
jgi:thiosulfate/3-mercaptopyruvate sulfurtransferase